MNRLPLGFLLGSSTTANVHRYLKETEISDGMMHRSAASSALTSAPDHSKKDIDDLLASIEAIKILSDLELDLGSTPQLSVSVQEDSNNNNKYKNMLRYLPNAGFQGEISSIGVSVPNTFKHKSHPNARTKELGTKALAAKKLEPLPNLEEEDSNPMKTSTVKGISLDNSQDATPSWMPAELGDKWDANGPSLPSGKKSKPGEWDFLNSEPNTFIHNPPPSDQPPTPMWKKMSKDYQNKPCIEPLQNIFMDDSNLKSNLRMSMSSTVSTPVATKDTDIHLTQQQIHQLEDILEKAKDQPDDYQIRGSPLKLFGNEYDTFTKAILTKFVEKVRSNANSVQRVPQPVLTKPPIPKLKIKNFTKSGDYTDQDFLKNANNLFAHIQQRGYKTDNIFIKPSDDSLGFQRSLSLPQSHNTATSTPKADRAKDIDVIASMDEYSSYSTDFDEDSSAESRGQNHQEITEGDRNDYTSFDKTFLTKDHLVKDDLGEEPNNSSTYTFDEFTDLDDRGRSLAKTATSESDEKLDNAKIRSMQKSELQISKRPVEVHQANDSMSSVKKFWSGNRSASSNNNSEEDFEFSEIHDTQTEQHIQWKRPSQLKLPRSDSKSSVMKDSDADNHKVVKGRVKPGVFPDQYGNMIFDFQENKWISNDKENDFHGSLDSIEDLVTSSADDERAVARKTREVSILKLANRSSKKQERNLEVSFQIPNNSSEILNPSSNFNVTGLSDLNNVTFTQTNKKLVSLLTGATSVTSWETIAFVDLSNKELENVEGMDKYLPNVKRLDLSNNRIRYIDGLPANVLELNLSQNMIENITSFRKFRDLQTLDASRNSLENLSSLKHNIHLTRLDLTGNNLRSLDGVKLLNSLMTLNLAQNNISGDIDFSTFDFPNLQELNLSENKVRSVTGLEKLQSLRVLNLNENVLNNIACGARHDHLKKLLLKFNRLKRLNLEPFPFLRVLRIDGNSLSKISDMQKLKFLQEISAKCQDSSSVTEKIILEVADVLTMDLSGNVIVSSIFTSPPLLDPFLNLNQLNLSAVGLTTIPDSFGDVFSNVRELNLNFNKLANLNGLSKLRKLKKLHVLSNNIDKIEMVLANLCNSRKSLKTLDMRLNAVNFEFYPYVFNPLELEFTTTNTNGTFKSSPIQLEALDDIENFSIHYNSLVKSKEEWQERDADFIEKLRLEGNNNRVKERLNYETILINFFPRLRELDGGSIPNGKREQLEQRIKLTEMTE